MSRFLTPLDARKLAPGPNGRGTYKLLAPLVYQSDLLGKTLAIPFGFVTDYASVPRLPLMFMVAGDTAHEAAVVHDWLYTVHAIDGREIDRDLADAVFREAVEAVEGSRILASVMWAGVRLGGGSSWDAEGRVQPEHVRQIIRTIQTEAS